MGQVWPWLGSLAGGRRACRAGGWPGGRRPRRRRKRRDRGVATAQGGTATVLVPQTQVVYETVQSVECVQVPVTHMQTLYRTEYRTEKVPVTRMVPETVNETRTVHGLRAASSRSCASR